MAIDVSDIVNDSDLGSNFVIQRSTGSFQFGGWQPDAPQNIQAFGPVRNTSGKELKMVPEGDQASELLTFHSTTRMFITSATGNQTSDVLQWQNDLYRVITVKNYSEQGYWLAIASRIAGN